MFNRIVAIIAVAVLPLVAFAVAVRVESLYEAKWREVLQQQIPAVTDAELRRMPLRRYCSEVSESRQLPVCGWYGGIGLMQWASLGALGLGFALLLAIYFTGRIAVADRQRLCQIFLPGLYGSFFVLIALTLLHGSLGAGIFFFSGVAVLNRPNPFTTLAAIVIGVGALLATVLLFVALLRTVGRAKLAAVGKVLTPKGSPKLWSYVTGLARKLDALPPGNIIVGLQPGFYVTQADILRAGDNLRGRTLYLSLPLCRIFTELELRATIGHELGHFRGQDTYYSQKFNPIYRGVSDSLEALEHNWHGDLRGLAFLPAHCLLTLFLDSFASAERKISRERELAADQAGVEVAGAEASASGLLKELAFSHYWESSLDIIRYDPTNGRDLENLSRAFADLVAREASATHFIGLDEKQLPHPTDSHPPLVVRLDAFGLSIAAIETAALEVSPERSAIELVDDFEQVEKELTKLERNYISKSGALRI